MPAQRGTKPWYQEGLQAQASRLGEQVKMNLSMSSRGRTSHPQFQFRYEPWDRFVSGPGDEPKVQATQPNGLEVPTSGIYGLISLPYSLFHARQRYRKSAGWHPQKVKERSKTASDSDRLSDKDFGKRSNGGRTWRWHVTIGQPAQSYATERAGVFDSSSFASNKAPSG